MKAIEVTINGVPHYEYPDGLTLPIIAGAQEWWEDDESATDSLDALIGMTLIDALTGQSGTLMKQRGPGDPRTAPWLYYLQAPGQNPLRINTGTILVDPLRNSFSVLSGGTFRTTGKLTDDDVRSLFGDGAGGLGDARDYAGEQAAADARAAAEAQKQRDFQAAQAEMDREIQRQNQARQEREARLAALLDNIRYLNEIQPDLARFGAGLNSVPLQGITPTVGYGNALEGNISTLQGQLQNPPPLGTPIPQVAPAPTLAGTGMAGGGSILPGSATMNIGTTKRGVLVGDREINGDEELLTMDPRTGEVEVIPIVGRAAEGAQFNFSDYGMTPAKWDTTSLYGALSPLLQPFNITSAGNVPNRTTARPTDFGYVTPKFSTDFAPVQPGGYSPLSSQYFEKNTGFLLPNPTTIMSQLRALRANDPVGYANVLSFYESATDQQGNPSGLPAEAIEAFLENSALSGRSLGFIGVR